MTIDELSLAQQPQGEQQGHNCEPGCGCPLDPWQNEITHDPAYEPWAEKVGANEPF